MQEKIKSMQKNLYSLLFCMLAQGAAVYSIVNDGVDDDQEEVTFTHPCKQKYVPSTVFPDEEWVMFEHTLFPEQTKHDLYHRLTEKRAADTVVFDERPTAKKARKTCSLTG